MYIITVIPIARGISKDTLTYFTKEEIKNGNIVTIPLRKKTAYGLVISSKPVNESKTEIKSLNYSIRKAKKGDTKKILPESYMKSLEYLADYYATSIGAAIHVLLPTQILESKNLPDIETKKIENENSHEVLLLQSDNEERYATYKSLIREEFAKGKSVFFCLPSIEDIKSAQKMLEKGIEQYTYVLHSKLNKNDIEDLWIKIIENTHPVLIIATGSFLLLAKSDIGTIIIDKESSRSYKMQTRPFMDIRTVAESVAKQNGMKLVFGDLLLRSETLWQEKNIKYSALSPLKFRLLSTANCQKVSMQRPQSVEKKEFIIVSDTLKKILVDAQENNEHTFLFCGRKGLYPETVCSDCGTIVTCHNCNAPVVLYGKKLDKTDKNLFVCHHCGERREASELCKKCGGWRLTTLGIGTEKVYEEVKKILPNTLIQILDKENATTHNQAVKIRNNFYANPGSVLIGTELALPYLNQDIENCAVISIDSFFSIPDFRINEKVFHILLEMREIAQKNMLIQTRQDSLSIFDNALKGNLMDFYRDEIQDRKEMSYPPFVTYIKITLEGTKALVKKQMSEIQEKFHPYQIAVFEAFTPKKTGSYTLHGLISLPQDSWVDEELLNKLRSLPPFVMVKVDPDTLL